MSDREPKNWQSRLKEDRRRQIPFTDIMEDPGRPGTFSYFRITPERRVGVMRRMLRKMIPCYSDQNDQDRYLPERSPPLEKEMTEEGNDEEGKKSLKKEERKSTTNKSDAGQSMAESIDERKGGEGDKKKKRRKRRHGQKRSSLNASPASAGGESDLRKLEAGRKEDWKAGTMSQKRCVPHVPVPRDQWRPLPPLPSAVKTKPKTPRREFKPNRSRPSKEKPGQRDEIKGPKYAPTFARFRRRCENRFRLRDIRDHQMKMRFILRDEAKERRLAALANKTTAGNEVMPNQADKPIHLEEQKCHPQSDERADATSTSPALHQLAQAVIQSERATRSRLERLELSMCRQHKLLITITKLLNRGLTQNLLSEECGPQPLALPQAPASEKVTNKDQPSSSTMKTKRAHKEKKSFNSISKESSFSLTDIDKPLENSHPSRKSSHCVTYSSAALPSLKGDKAVKVTKTKKKKQHNKKESSFYVYNRQPIEDSSVEDSSAIIHGGHEGIAIPREHKHNAAADTASRKRKKTKKKHEVEMSLQTENMTNESLATPAQISTDENASFVVEERSTHIQRGKRMDERYEVNTYSSRKKHHNASTFLETTKVSYKMEYSTSSSDDAEQSVLLKKSSRVTSKNRRVSKYQSKDVHADSGSDEDFLDTSTSMTGSTGTNKTGQRVKKQTMSKRTTGPSFASSTNETSAVEIDYEKFKSNDATPTRPAEERDITSARARKREQGRKCEEPRGQITSSQMCKNFQAQAKCVIEEADEVGFISDGQQKGEMQKCLTSSSLDEDEEDFIATERDDYFVTTSLEKDETKKNDDDKMETKKFKKKAKKAHKQASFGDSPDLVKMDNPMVDRQEDHVTPNETLKKKHTKKAKKSKELSKLLTSEDDSSLNAGPSQMFSSTKQKKARRVSDVARRNEEKTQQDVSDDDFPLDESEPTQAICSSTEKRRVGSFSKSKNQEKQSKTNTVVSAMSTNSDLSYGESELCNEASASPAELSPAKQSPVRKQGKRNQDSVEIGKETIREKVKTRGPKISSKCEVATGVMSVAVESARTSEDGLDCVISPKQREKRHKKRKPTKTAASSTPSGKREDEVEDVSGTHFPAWCAKEKEEVRADTTISRKKKGRQAVKEYESATGNKTNTISAQPSHEIDEHVKKHTKAVRLSPEKTKENTRELIALEMSEVQNVDISEEEGDGNNKDSSLQDKKLKKEASQDSCDHTDLSFNEETEKTSAHERSDDSKKSESKNEEDFDEFCAVVSPTSAQVTGGRDKEQDSKTSENEHETDPAGQVESLSGEVMNKNEERKMDKEEKKRLKMEKRKKKKRNKESAGIESDEASADTIRAHSKKSRKKRKVPKVWKKFKHEQGLFMKKKYQKKSISSNNLDETSADAERKIDGRMDSLNATSFNNSEEMAASGEAMSKKMKKKVKKEEKRRLKEKKLEEKKADGEDNGETGERDSDGAIKAKDKKTHKKHKAAKAWKKFKKEQGLYIKKKRRKQKASSEDMEVNPTAEDEKLQDSDHAQMTENKDGEKDSQGEVEELGKTEDATSSDVTAQSEKNLPSKSPKPLSAWKKFKHEQGLFRKPKMQPVSSKEAQQSTDRDESLALKDKGKHEKEMEKREKKTEKKQKKQARKEEKQKEKEEKKQKKEEQKIKKRLMKGGDNDSTNDAESAPKKKNRGLVKFLKGKKEKQIKKSQSEPHASEKAPAEPVLARCRTVAPLQETSTVEFVTLKSPTEEETVVAKSEQILDIRADAKSTDLTPGWCDQVRANVYKHEDVQRSLQKEIAVKNVRCADDVATSYDQHQAEDSEVARVHIEQDDDSSDGWFDAEGNTVVTNRHQENTRAKTESTSSTPGFEKTAPTSITKVHQDEKILSQRFTVPNNDSAAYDKADSIRESEPRQNQRREIMHQILQELSSSDESSTQSDKTPEVLNDKTAPEMDILSEGTPAPTLPSQPCWLEICKEEPQIKQERGTIFSVKDDVGEDQIFSGLPSTTSKDGSAEKPKDAHPHQSGRKGAESKEEVLVHPPRVECETKEQSVNEAASSNNKQVTDAVIEDIEDTNTSDGSEGKIAQEVFTKQPSAPKQPESDYISWDEESEEDIGQRKENLATSVDMEMADELLGQLPPSGKQPADIRKREDVIRKKDHLEETGLTELDVIEQMLQQSFSADLDIFGIVDKMPPCKNDTSSLKPKNDTVNSTCDEELNSLPKCEDKDEVVKTEKKTKQSSQGGIQAKPLTDELDGESKAVKGKDLRPTNLSEQSTTPSSPDTEIEKRKIQFSVVPRDPTITRKVREPLKGILKKQTTSSASQEPNAELPIRAQAPVRFLEDPIKNTGEESGDLGFLSPGNADDSNAVVMDTLIHSANTKSYENCDRKQATLGSPDSVEAEDQARLEEINPQRNNSDSPDLIEELQDPVFSLSQESSSESEEDFSSPSMDHEEHIVEATVEKKNKTQAFLDSYTQDRLKKSLIQAGKQNSISALQENEIPHYLRDDFNPAPEQKPFEKWNPVTAKKQLDKMSQSKRRLPQSTTPRWLKADFNPDGSAPKREAWKSPKERDVLCFSPKSDFDFDCTSLTPETREMGRKEIENENKKILNSMRNQEQFRNSRKAVANHSTPSTPPLANEDIPRYLRADFDPAPDQKPFKRWNPVDAKKKFTKICSKSKLADSPKKGSTGSALSSAETPRWLQPDFNPATDAPTTSTPSVCKPAANLQQPEIKNQKPETSQTDSSPLWSHHHEVQPEAAFEPEYHGTVGGLYGEDPPMRDGVALADDTLGWTQPHSHHDHQYHAQHRARETSGPHGVLQSEVRALGASSVPAWLQTEPPPPQTVNHMPLLPGVKPVDKGLPRHPDVMVESHSGQSLQDDSARGRGFQSTVGVKGSQGVPPTLSTQRDHLQQTAITPKWMQPDLNSSIPQTARPRNNKVPPHLQGADVQVLGSGKLTSLPQSNMPKRGTLNMPALPGVSAKKGTPQLPSTLSPVFTKERGALSRSSLQPTVEPEDSISSGAPSPEPPQYSWMRPGYGWTDTAWQDSTKERRMLLNTIAKAQATRQPRAM